MKGEREKLETVREGKGRQGESLAGRLTKERENYMVVGL